MLLLSLSRSTGSCSHYNKDILVGGEAGVRIQISTRFPVYIRGIRAERGRSGTPLCSRLPITPGILRKLRRSWVGRDSSFDSVMLWAASLTTFFSFCRSGEVTVESVCDPNSHLSFSDVATDEPSSPSLISLNIKLSKTDQGRVDCQVVLGKTNDDLCPVTELLEYLARRGGHSGALFQWHDGMPLSKSKFVEVVRKTLAAANLPAQQYAGHSFRNGAATTAAMMGLQDSAIQTLGCWKSDCYQLFIKANPRHLASLSSSLSKSTI